LGWGWTVVRLKKSKSVYQLLEQLRRRLGRDAFDVVDHWDADLCAVGVSRPGTASPLVYISTWRQPPGRYFVSLEHAPEAAPDGPYKQGGEVKGLDLDKLVATIARHLNLTDAGRAPR